jgi:hypothetical protein
MVRQALSENVKVIMKERLIGWLGAALILSLMLAGAVTAGEAEALEAYLRVFPEVKSIGVLYSEPRHEEGIARLSEAAAKHKVGVIKVKVPSIKEFPGALQDMKGKADTLWVVDDQLYSLQEAWNFLVMFTLRNKIKTVVATEQALGVGGLFYYSPAKEVTVNKRILEVMGLTIAEKAGPVKYYEASKAGGGDAVNK